MLFLFCPIARRGKAQSIRNQSQEKAVRRDIRATFYVG
jgi:hypothetical protein